jgi:hypothetical protein
MESMGDFYAIALHDKQLRAGLVAMHQQTPTHRLTWPRTARSRLAAALRAVAASVEAADRAVEAEPRRSVVAQA